MNLGFFLMLAGFSLGFLRQAPPPEYFPVEKNGSVFYIDTSGNQVTGAVFSGGRPFSEGLAAVSVSRQGEETKWYYVRSDMSIAIKAGFYDAGDFSEGAARVRTRNGWSFYDSSGSYSFEGIFDSAGDFSNGYARVKKGNKWGLVSREGRQVIVPAYHRMMDFSENRIAVQQEQDGWWGYISLSGDYILTDSFLSAGNFREGIAPVRKSGGWQYIDDEGKKISDFTYDEARPFYRGIACVRVRDAWKLIDRQGQELFGLVLRNPADFGRSLCWIETLDGKKGYINAAGKWVYIYRE